MLCCLVTVLAWFSITFNQNRTRRSVDRLIINGANATKQNTMHYVDFLHRKGQLTKIDVSGNASTADVKDLIQALVDDEDPEGWKVTEWKIAGGGTIKVSTPKLDDETVEEQCARHDAFVAELQETFPPI